MYKKSGENQKTLYLDCLRQPNCIAGANYYKESHEWVHISKHSDEKPDGHLLFKIEFEEFLKNEVRKSENANVSVLNIYKRAKHTQFKGIWLPTTHQTLFLAKLRRIRNYEKKEKPSRQENPTNRVAVQMADVATSPTILQRVVYSVNVATSPILSLPLDNKNVTPSNQSLISQRIAYSPHNISQNSLLRNSILDLSNAGPNSTQTQPTSSIDGKTPLLTFSIQNKNDATTSPGLPSPIHNKDATPPNQSGIVQRVYSANKNSQYNMRRSAHLNSWNTAMVRGHFLSYQNDKDLAISSYSRKNGPFLK